MKNLKTKNTTQFNPFSGPEIERIIPITKAQSEILIDCHLGGNDAKRAYNISYSLKISGDLNFNALEDAVKSLIRRHESLRASFSEDIRFMCIYSDFHIEISYEDISTQAEADKQKSRDFLIKEDANYIFDLVNGPLLKITVIKGDSLDHSLVLTFHHAICDGLSVDAFLQELAILYSAYTENRAPNLSEPIRFSLFAEKENLFTESEEYKNSESFWLNMYDAPVPKVELPTDYARPTTRTYQNGTLYFKLSNSFFDALKQTGVNSGSGIVTTFTSVFEIFLYQLTGQNDLVVGLCNSRHAHYNMLGMIGHCVNVLPLRSKIDTKISFKDYLQQRRTQLFDAYEHQSISFGQLLEKLSISRDVSRIPLVPVMLNIEFNNDLESSFSFSGLSHELKINDRDYATFEIEIQAFISKDGPCIQWNYNTSIFKPETITQMMDSFKKLTKKLISNPSKSISEIISADYLDAYNALNDTDILYTHEPLHELILAKALEAGTANHNAIVFEGTPISYSKLFKQVNQLTHFFVDQGIKEGDVIGVSLPRCQELPIVLLAIMQCGATYVPLDPTYPPTRLGFMLEDSEAKLLITNENISASFPTGIALLYLEDALKQIERYPTDKLNLKVNETSPCYILYTSGSTGKPKGVTVTHKNLVNFLFSMADQPGIKETDKLLSITTISFDIAGLELFLPLLAGATLVIADDTTARDGRLLHELLIKEHISILQATPTTWRMLLDSGWKMPLPLKALCGGEALPLNLAQELNLKCDSLWNMYGPTETTIWSSVKLIDKNEQVITIGKPIANTQIYILNEQGHLVPPGAIGEIIIGGDGVALGYLKRPELTTEKFISNLFNLGHTNTYYKTGDLGKLLPSGEVLCLGRIDQQVKVRGHRIELGEIEQAITRLDNVHMAVVLADSDSLTAYVVPKEKLNEDIVKTVIDVWKNALKTQLPLHLIPNTFNILDRLPTTLNDKIDRKALLEMQGFSRNSSLSYTAPRTPAEEIVAEIWQDSLALEKVDIFSNFFELGGHSLLAVKVMRHIEEKTGKHLPLSTLFEYPTIERLAEVLKLDKEISSDSLIPIKPAGNKTPIYFIHGAGLNVLIFHDLAKNLDKDQPVYALEGTRIIQKDNTLSTVEEIAAYYLESIMKVNPDGPYAIAGYSFGGIIAYEMGRQLMIQGKKISMLSILDTYVSPEYYFSSPLRKKVAKINLQYKRRFTYFKEMLSSWDKAVQHINRKKNFIISYYFSKKTFKTEEDEMNFKQFLIADAKVSKIVNRYHLVPFPLKIDLFKAKNNDDFLSDRIYLGWGKIALEGVIIHDIPGNHLNIFSYPHVTEFAKTLQKVLDERRANI